MGRKLADRCSSAVNSSIQNAQEDIIEKLKPLLPSSVEKEIYTSLPCRKFDLSYNLNCDKLCADFQEDIAFRFSFGWTSLVNRYLGEKNARLLLAFAEPTLQVPRPVTTPSANGMPAMSPQSATQEELMFSLMSGLASLTSRGSVGVIIVGGVIWRAVGWRLIAGCLLGYGGLYLYERLTWSTRAKERTFKQQFVNYAAKKLHMIVSITSANCSHQVQKELENTFIHLCQQVDITERELIKSINNLTDEIKQLEGIQSNSKVLRNKATHLEAELDQFIKTFLHQSK
ncbi:mitofusin-1 isoform X1 [Pelobates cultripes]|nr:mitofusin-1 isoform X1 [Pelobates cultripes]